MDENGSHHQVKQRTPSTERQASHFTHILGQTDGDFIEERELGRRAVGRLIKGARSLLDQSKKIFESIVWYCAVAIDKANILDDSQKHTSWKTNL